MPASARFHGPGRWCPVSPSDPSSPRQRALEPLTRLPVPSAGPGTATQPVRPAPSLGARPTPGWSPRGSPPPRLPRSALDPRAHPSRGRGRDRGQHAGEGQRGPHDVSLRVRGAAGTQAAQAGPPSEPSGHEKGSLGATGPLAVLLLEEGGFGDPGKASERESDPSFWGLRPPRGLWPLRPAVRAPDRRGRVCAAFAWLGAAGACCVRARARGRGRRLGRRRGAGHSSAPRGPPRPAPSAPEGREWLRFLGAGRGGRGAAVRAFGFREPLEKFPGAGLGRPRESPFPPPGTREPGRGAQPLARGTAGPRAPAAPGGQAWPRAEAARSGPLAVSCCHLAAAARSTPAPRAWGAGLRGLPSRLAPSPFALPRRPPRVPLPLLRGCDGPRPALRRPTVRFCGTFHLGRWAWGHLSGSFLWLYGGTPSCPPPAQCWAHPAGAPASHRRSRGPLP